MNIYLEIYSFKDVYVCLSVLYLMCVYTCNQFKITAIPIINLRRKAARGKFLIFLSRITQKTSALNAPEAALEIGRDVSKRRRTVGGFCRTCSYPPMSCNRICVSMYNAISRFVLLSESSF